MELRHLRYFVAVAEELHFGRAADRLHVAQPAVSDQIRKLEAMLGAPLFQRTPRSVSLTDAGDALLPEAVRVLRQAGRAQEAVHRATKDRGERLRIGTTAFGPPHQVLRSLARLRTTGSATPEIVAGEARDLLEDLRDGELDAAVVHTPVLDRGLRLAWRAPSPIVAAVPAFDPRAGDRIFDHSTSCTRVLLLPRSNDPGFHDSAISRLRQGQACLDEVREAPNSVDQLMLIVATGSVVGILPQATADRVTHHGVEIRRLPGFIPAAQVALITRDGPTSRPLRDLLALLQRDPLKGGANEALWPEMVVASADA